MGLPLIISDDEADGVLRLPDAGVAGIDIASGLPVTVRGVRRVHAKARRSDPDGEGYIIGNDGTAPLFVGLSVAQQYFTADLGVPAGNAARDAEWREWLLAGSPGSE